MKKKLLLLALAVVLVAAISVTAFAVLEEPEEEPYVDSWEATENMTDEELIAIGREILRSEQGSWPDHAFAACFRLQEIDPELAEAAFEHMESQAKPAMAPQQKNEDTLTPQNDEKERFGATFRNGGNEYDEYYDFDEAGNADALSAPELEQKSSLEDEDGIAPHDVNDYAPVANPKGNKVTATIVKIYAKPQANFQTIFSYLGKWR